MASMGSRVVLFVVLLASLGIKQDAHAAKHQGHWDDLGDTASLV